MLEQLWNMFFKKGDAQKPLSRDEESRLSEAQKQAWLAKSVVCILYAFVGDVRTEIHRRKVDMRKRYFTYKDGNYLLITTKEKLIIEKAPWYSLGVQWVAKLKFDEGDAIPISHKKSDEQTDAYGLNRVMDKSSRDTMLPTSDSMLTMIIMLLVVGLIMALGFAGYALVNPNAASDISNFATPRSQIEGN